MRRVLNSPKNGKVGNSGNSGNGTPRAVRCLTALPRAAADPRIEYFNGPHTIHGVGTFELLHRHLDWGESFEW